MRTLSPPTDQKVGEMGKERGRQGLGFKENPTCGLRMNLRDVVSFVFVLLFRGSSTIALGCMCVMN